MFFSRTLEHIVLVHYRETQEVSLVNSLSAVIKCSVLQLVLVWRICYSCYIPLCNEICHKYTASVSACCFSLGKVRGAASNST